jgi:NAD(P)-dependent dehydrogenase (short-subunit alcohol dehydrogenase family)
MMSTDSFRLDGKVALVTGSGRAIAEIFGALGASVVVDGHSDTPYLTGFPFDASA